MIWLHKMTVMANMTMHRMNVEFLFIICDLVLQMYAICNLCATFMFAFLRESTLACVKYQSMDKNRIFMQLLPKTNVSIFCREYSFFNAGGMVV